MARKEKPGAEEEKGDMDMSPMIDMVFLLLIFFVVNANALTVKKDQNIELSKAKHAKDIKSINNAIVINVYHEKRPGGMAANVKWSNEDSKPLNDKQSLIEEIKTKAQELVEAQKITKPAEAVLYIRADANVKFGDVREILRASAEAGVSRNLFATHR